MLAQLTASSALPKTLNAVHTLVLLPNSKSLPRDAFPLDEDYEPALDSKVADIKQCTLDANHILAARFLKRFVEHDLPWLHVDLSASRCEGGLGSVASDVTGFGVAWGLRMLQAK